MTDPTQPPRQEPEPTPDHEPGPGPGPEREPEADADAGRSGGVAIGSLSGGAVAAGPDATAEDRAERTTTPAPYTEDAEGTGTRVPPQAPPAAKGISIGAMSGGAVASGARARAVDASTRAAPADGSAPIAAPAELRAAIAALRAQLQQLDPDDTAPDSGTGAGPGADLDAGLAEAEEEIDATGQVRPDRLQRLRERLDLGATAMAGLASAATLAQVISQLLGVQG